MKFTFTPKLDKSSATLACDKETQVALVSIRSEEPENWGTMQSEAEALESFLCNSDWDWVSPSETGDLTDAPMIGTRDEEGMVIERYAFMDYALRSFLDDLADTGEAFFQGGD